MVQDHNIAASGVSKDGNIIGIGPNGNWRSLHWSQNLAHSAAKAAWTVERLKNQRMDQPALELTVKLCNRG